MRLSLTPLPSAVGVKTVLPNTDPSSGVVTATARPTVNAWAVGQGILGAFGVRLDLMGAGRDHGENLELLNAWLTAYRARILVLRHATNISRRAALDDLLDLCLATGVDLALTCDDTVGERLAGWVTERTGVIDEDHCDLLDRIARTQATTRTAQVEGGRTRRVSNSKSWKNDGSTGPGSSIAGAGTGADGVDEVEEVPRLLPRVDFYKFRARCRDTLTQEEFAAVDAQYVHAFRQVRQQPFPTSETAAARLRQMTEDTDNPGVALTRLRAAQAAMFTRGLYLNVHVPYFLSVICDNEHRRLTEPEVRALAAYRTPWRSAGIVLADANLDADAVRRLTVGDVTDDGTLPTTEHEPMHPPAAIFLRAQRHLRLIQGAEPSDRFITQPPTTIAAARRRAAIDLNIPRTPTRRTGGDAVLQRWRLHLGAVVMPLVDQRLPAPEEIERWGDGNADD